MAPNGECTEECPAHLESSKAGSTTIDDCFTIKTNMFVVSDAANRIAAINADSDYFQLIKEGGEVDGCIDNELINETELFVSMQMKSRVDKFSIEGNFIGTLRCHQSHRHPVPA